MLKVAHQHGTMEPWYLTNQCAHMLVSYTTKPSIDGYTSDFQNFFGHPHPAPADMVRQEGEGRINPSPNSYSTTYPPKQMYIKIFCPQNHFQ